MDYTGTVHEIINPSTLEEIGKFRRTHALQGEINAEVYDDLSDEQMRELAFVIVEIDGIPTPFRIESVRTKGAVSMLIKLAGVDSADSASTFVNQLIYADARALEACTSEEDDVPSDREGVYAIDLAGYSAVDTLGNELGTVEHVDVSTANPLLELFTEEGQTVLIPLNGPFIADVDMQKQVVTIDAPDALLGLNVKKQ